MPLVLRTLIEAVEWKANAVENRGAARHALKFHQTIGLPEGRGNAGTGYALVVPTNACEVFGCTVRHSTRIKGSRDRHAGNANGKDAIPAKVRDKLAAHHLCVDAADFARLCLTDQDRKTDRHGETRYGHAVQYPHEKRHHEL